MSNQEQLIIAKLLREYLEKTETMHREGESPYFIIGYLQGMVRVVADKLEE
jgi:hypothetical protein